MDAGDAALLRILCVAICFIRIPVKGPDALVPVLACLVGLVLINAAYTYVHRKVRLPDHIYEQYEVFVKESEEWERKKAEEDATKEAAERAAQAGTDTQEEAEQPAKAPRRSKRRKKKAKSEDAGTSQPPETPGEPEIVPVATRQADEHGQRQEPVRGGPAPEASAEGGDGTGGKGDTSSQAQEGCKCPPLPPELQWELEEAAKDLEEERQEEAEYCRQRREADMAESRIARKNMAIRYKALARRVRIRAAKRQGKRLSKQDKKEEVERTWWDHRQDDMMDMHPFWPHVVLSVAETLIGTFGLLITGWAMGGPLRTDPVMMAAVLALAYTTWYSVTLPMQWNSPAPWLTDYEVTLENCEEMHIEPCETHYLIAMPLYVFMGLIPYAEPFRRGLHWGLLLLALVPVWMSSGIYVMDWGTWYQAWPLPTVYCTIASFLLVQLLVVLHQSWPFKYKITWTDKKAPDDKHQADKKQSER